MIKEFDATYVESIHHIKYASNGKTRFIIIKIGVIYKVMKFQEWDDEVEMIDEEFESKKHAYYWLKDHYGLKTISRFDVVNKWRVFNQFVHMLEMGVFPNYSRLVRVEKFSKVY